MDSFEINKSLLDFIAQCPTCYQVTDEFAKELEAHNFIRLYENEHWTLTPNRNYFVTRNDSSLIAFKIPKQEITGIQLAAAHSDSPLLKIKPNPELACESAYVKLNIEKYGGLLCAPWMDRPLSIAGRVVLRTSDGVESKLVDLRTPVALVPSLAIHMDSKGNAGREYKVQTDLAPLISLDPNFSLNELIAKNIGVDTSDIIASDLFCYNTERNLIWGPENEFISSRSLDDLQCAWSCMTAFIQAEPLDDRMSVCAVFDNEEVGSATKQGADSSFLHDVLLRIEGALQSSSKEDMQSWLANSMMISADNAHSVHPNHPEVACPSNRPHLNEGIVIKHSANQRYTTDALSAAAFKLICERANVPTQDFTNHSDRMGGSTLGNISTTHVSINSVDVGLAQLAMHSPFETAGTKDTAYMVQAMKAFFESEFTPKKDGSYRI